MTDTERLAEVRRLIAEMSEEFKHQVFNDVTNMPDNEGNLPMLLRHSEKLVRVDFRKAVEWFAMEKPKAMQFAFAILQHAGVEMQSFSTDHPQS